LFSFVLEDAPTTTAPFYDVLRCCKGPSLGTTYTLVSPYTQLAHYDALEWADSMGVSPWLLRVSTGEEEDLVSRFEAAFKALPMQVG
jgi:cystathionine gamma-synthase